MKMEDGIGVLILLSFLFFSILVIAFASSLSKNKSFCEASFYNKTFNLALLSQNDLSILDNCKGILSKKSEINKLVCRATAELGKIDVKWNNKTIYSFDIECEEFLADEGVPITVNGFLTVLHADNFDNGKSEYIYTIKDNKYKKYNLILEKGFLPFLTGSEVKVRGELYNNSIILASGDEGSIQQISAASTQVSGQQKTIVLIGNLYDGTVRCSKDQIKNTMFTDVNNSIDKFYQENSFGAVSFEGNVSGPFTINQFGSFCYSVGVVTGTWVPEVDNVARASGVNFSLYNRKVYIFPANTNCGALGVATLGGGESSGNASIAAILDCNRSDIYGHEIGHNFWMHHAATDTNNDGMVDTHLGECDVCDYSDVMSYAGTGLRQINAPHKDQIGWTPQEKVFTPTNSGIYSISALELFPLQTSLPQIIKIPRKQGDYYYLSYRVPIGFDIILNSNYTNKLNIHYYAGRDSVKTYFVKSLNDMEFFVDTYNNLTIRQLSHTLYDVTVNIDYGRTGSCNPHPADINPQNWRIIDTEVSLYGSCWLTGCNWQGQGQPIDTYVSRAGALWLTGADIRGYTCNVTNPGNYPSTWILA